MRQGLNTEEIIYIMEAFNTLAGADDETRSDETSNARQVLGAYLFKEMGFTSKSVIEAWGDIRDSELTFYVKNGIATILDGKDLVAHVSPDTGYIIHHPDWRYNRLTSEAINVTLIYLASVKYLGGISG